MPSGKASYELSGAAIEDLADIAAYTIDRFGILRARRYRDALKRHFTQLAQHPNIGRDYAHIRSGLRRYESQSHSIYYMQTASGVLIVRVLHARRDPARHL